MYARQSQSLYRKPKTAKACALDPRQYDNRRFWDLVYELDAVDVKCVELAIKESGLPLDVEYAFPDLDVFKANVDKFCFYPERVLQIIERSRVEVGFSLLS